MPKKPVILPQVGTGFDDVFSTLIHDPKKKKPVDKPENPPDDKDKSVDKTGGHHVQS
jgi:hypothetical protein